MYQTLIALAPYQEVLDRDWNQVGMWLAGVLIFLLLLGGVAGIIRWLMS